MRGAARIRSAADRIPSLRSARDTRALARRAGSTIDSLRSLHVEAMERLRPAWNEYTSSVSTPDMAASLELAGLLETLVRMIGPGRVADLGSGFSSFVLRDPELGIADVVSVDDSAPWLEATERFLRAKHLSTEGLMTWERFDAGGLGHFDLILHDLGSMETRARALAGAVGALTPAGSIVLDDCHKRGYRLAVESFAAEHPAIDVFDLKNLTRDSFGRYCWVGMTSPVTGAA